MDRIFILQYRSGLDTRNPSAPCHTRFPRHAGHGFRPGHHHPGPRRLRHRLHRIPDRRPDPGAGARFRRVGPAGRATGRAVRLHGHAGRPAAHGRAGARERKRLFVAILLVFAGANALAALAPNLWCWRWRASFLRWRCRCSGARPARPPRAWPPLRAGQAVSRVYLGISAALFGIPIGTLAAAAIGWRASFWGWRRCRCCWPR